MWVYFVIRLYSTNFSRSDCELHCNVAYFATKIQDLTFNIWGGGGVKMTSSRDDLASHPPERPQNSVPFFRINVQFHDTPGLSENSLFIFSFLGEGQFT